MLSVSCIILVKQVINQKMKRKITNNRKTAVTHSKSKYPNRSGAESDLHDSQERSLEGTIKRNFPSIIGTTLKGKTMNMGILDEPSQQGFPSEADISVKTRELKRSTENSQIGRREANIGAMSMESTLVIENNYGVQVHVSENSINRSHSKPTFREDSSEQFYVHNEKTLKSTQKQVTSQSSISNKRQSSDSRRKGGAQRGEASGPVSDPVPTEIIQNAHSTIEQSLATTVLNTMTNAVSEYAYDQEEPIHQLPEYSMSPVKMENMEKMANFLMLESAQSTMKMSSKDYDENQTVVQHTSFGSGGTKRDVVPIPLTGQSLIGNVTVETGNGQGSRRSLAMQNSLYSKEDIESGHGIVSFQQTSQVHNMSKEAQISAKVVSDYQRKKKKHLKTTRVFSDDMIAQLDKATEKRTDMVASLLGNSREARDIQKQFRKMVEVPQEDFDLDKFKLLSVELRQMQKPDQMFEQQLKINPRLAKRTIQIEDFVHILPTSAESHTRLSADSNRQRRDSLYHSSIAGDSQNEDLPLAIQDNPARTLAIQYMSKKQSAPNIQTSLQSNHNNSIQVDEQYEDDENTFITNLVESNYLSQPKPGTLPNIKMKNQDLVVHNSNSQSDQNQQQLQVFNQNQENKKDQIQYTNEYQLVSLRKSDHTQNSIQEYRSASVLARDSQMTLASSAIANRKSKMSAMKSSLSSLPYSRERMQREKSELSFTAGHRRPMNSTGGRRILGEQNGVIHSSMSSALGRESRVLKRIYERVENIKKTEQPGGGSRLGATIPEAHNTNRLGGSRTAGLRKHSIPTIPRPLNRLINGRASSIEPHIMMPQYETGKDENRGLDSSETRMDASYLSSLHLKVPSPHHVIVDTAVNPAKVENESLNIDETGRLISTMHRSVNQSGDLIPHDFSRHQLQQLENGDQTPVGRQKHEISSKYLLQKPRSIASENTRLDSQKVLNQYKQRRILVGNMQLSKLIRKDMNMFAKDGPKKRDKRKDSINQKSGAGVHEKVPSMQTLRVDRTNSLLDDEASVDENNNMKSVIDLMSKPLVRDSDGPQEGNISDGTLTSERKNDYGLKTAPIVIETNKSLDYLAQAPNTEQFLAENRMNLEQPSLMRPVSNDSIIIEVVTSTSEVRNKSTESLLKPKLLQMSPGGDEQIILESSGEQLMMNQSLMQDASHYKVESKWDHTDRYQQEVKQYYKKMNNHQRNSQTKLSKVQIRGKNIFDSNAIVGSQNNSLKSGPTTVQMADQERITNSQLKEDQVQTIYNQSETGQDRSPGEPLSLQVSGKFNMPSPKAEDYKDESDVKRYESGAGTSLGQLQQKVIKDHMNQILRGSQNVQKGQLLVQQQNLEKTANATQQNQRIPVQRGEQQQVWGGHQSSGTPQVPYGNPTQGDSHVTTHYNDPYGTHNAAYFSSIYEEQKSKLVHEPEVAGLSQKGNLRRDSQLQQKQATRDAKMVAQFAHKVQINSPFQYRTTQQHNEQRTPSITTDSKPSPVEIRQMGQVKRLSAVMKGNGNSDSQSQGTLENNNKNSHLVSSQHTLTPNQSNVVSHINLNANFDLKTMHTISQPRVRGHAHNRSTTQEAVQKKSGNSPSKVRPMEAIGQSASLMRLAETTYVDKGTGESNISSHGQTVGTNNQNSQFYKNSNASAPQSQQLEQAGLPKIKIKMVLTNEQSRRNSINQQSEVHHQIILDTSQKQFDEQTDSNNVESSRIVVTETNQDMPLNIMSKRVSNREPLHPRSNSQRQNQLRTQESNENIDLLPVIQDDSQAEAAAGGTGDRNIDNSKNAHN